MTVSASTHSVATVAPTDAVLIVTVDADGGTWTFTYEGEPSPDMVFDIDATDATAAAESMDSLEPGDLVITGGPGDDGGNTPYTFTFGGNKAGSVQTITTDPTNLTGTGTADVTVDTAGSPRTPVRLNTLVQTDARDGSEVRVANTGGDVAYLGGPDVTSSTGFPLPNGVSLPQPLCLADSEGLFAVTADGDSTTVTVLETGV